MKKYYSPWPNSPSSTGDPRGTGSSYKQNSGPPIDHPTEAENAGKYQHKPLVCKKCENGVHDACDDLSCLCRVNEHKPISITPSSIEQEAEAYANRYAGPVQGDLWYMLKEAYADGALRHPVPVEGNGIYYKAITFEQWTKPEYNNKPHVPATLHFHRDEEFYLLPISFPEPSGDVKILVDALQKIITTAKVTLPKQFSAEDKVMTALYMNLHEAEKALSSYQSSLNKGGKV